MIYAFQDLLYVITFEAFIDMNFLLFLDNQLQMHICLNYILLVEFNLVDPPPSKHHQIKIIENKTLRT